MAKHKIACPSCAVEFETGVDVEIEKTKNPDDVKNCTCPKCKIDFNPVTGEYDDEELPEETEVIEKKEDDETEFGQILF